MRKPIIVLLAVVLSLATTAASAQSAQHKPQTVHKQSTAVQHRVVVQLSTADTLEQKGLMNNLRHLKEGWGDSVQIEVVVHGPGIDMMTRAKSTQGGAIQQMIGKGVRFVVCRNTMKQRGITDDQLLPGVSTVPMGVGEIIRKQEEGWSYLKAGF